MQELAIWLTTNETVNVVFQTVLFATMVLPMIALSIWYHWNIRKTKGGNKLIHDHNNTRSAIRSRRLQYNNQSIEAADTFSDAISLHRGIMSGRYGKDAKIMQIQVYKVVGWWLLAITIIGLSPILVSWVAGT